MHLNISSFELWGSCLDRDRRRRRDRNEPAKSDIGIVYQIIDIPPLTCSGEWRGGFLRLGGLSLDWEPGHLGPVPRGDTATYPGSPVTLRHQSLRRNTKTTTTTTTSNYEPLAGAIKLQLNLEGIFYPPWIIFLAHPGENLGMIRSTLTLLSHSVLLPRNLLKTFHSMMPSNVLSNRSSPVLPSLGSSTKVV